MQYGAHLPLIDLDGSGWRPSTFASYARTAGELGYRYLTANDHLTFSRPWLDGLVALSSVIGSSREVELVTSVALPVVRGPANLVKSAVALDILSGGRLILGVGPGSSGRDYAAVGIDFEQRCERFDEALRVLRAHLSSSAQPFAGRFYSSEFTLDPRPQREDGVPIWVGSWGSLAGMRRVARLADGWIASAYNLTPAQVVAARATLNDALRDAARSSEHFPCSLATMWTYVTESHSERDRQLSELGRMLGRDAETLYEQLLIGSTEHCAEVLRSYHVAGIERVFVWPLAEPESQLERVMLDVAPLVDET
jgi:alkanesulfonate monooxygenase SsuD/methylene tetrahydromethanopterin reductase-like flavin-dependent oxidoreductase (luciferase family)